MQKLANMIGFIRRQPLWRLIVAVAVLAVAGWFVFRDGGGSTAKIPTFAARRGPLEITVLEGGSLQALESQEIKCEVRVGYQGTKILKIVEEGYLVTDDDVKTNKVLVELDGSDLQKQIVQQEIQYQNAVASLTDSQQGYEIQLNQNQSDIKAAEQKARFARIDFDKFLGDSVTTDLVAAGFAQASGARRHEQRGRNRSCRRGCRSEASAASTRRRQTGVGSNSSDQREHSPTRCHTRVGTGCSPINHGGGGRFGRGRRTSY
jgi:multidrug efflux pump subunit AcrA (membrane-fusion protein)